MKKTLITLLALSLLVSCAPAEDETNVDETIPDDKESITETEPAETEDPATLHDLPEGLSFDGANFHILASDRNQSNLYSDSAKYSGRLMDDTRFEMLQDLMATLDVTVSEESTFTTSCMNYYSALATAGDTSYDCINFMDRYALEGAIQGFFVPLQEVNYIDLTKDYWGEELSKKLSIGNKNYFAVGSMELSIYKNLSSVVFNNRLADQYNITIPFDDVDNGTWTFDKLASYGNIATADTDGDGVTNQWTYGADKRAVPMMMVISSGYRIIDKDENDNLQLKVFENHDLFVDVLDKVRNTLYTTGDMRLDTYPTFEDGTELTCFANFNYFEWSFADMEDDFSVLPIPKYDETQKEYRSRSFDSTFTCIPVQAKDKDKCGAVLECLNSYGYRHLLPAYLEDILKGRLARDPRSSANIQLIYETRTIELGEAYLFGRFGDSSMASMVLKENVASFLARIKELTENDFEEIMGSLS